MAQALPLGALQAATHGVEQAAEPAPLAIPPAAPPPEVAVTRATVVQEGAPSATTPAAQDATPNQRGAGLINPASGKGHAKGDPLEKFNRAMYSLNNFFDRILFRPMALIYKTIFPKPVRVGIRHVLSNLGEPVVFLNDLAQLRPKRAMRTFSRFIINSTAGVGGILDVAKTADLPHRDNGLGNTLARYGVGSGPYIFLPFIGPSTFRDIISDQVDGLVLPLAIGRPFNEVKFIIPSILAQGLDQRVEFEQQIKIILRSSADPYATIRSLYLQERASEVADVRGQSATPALDDPLTDPEAGAAPPPTGEPPATPPPGTPAPDASPPAPKPPVINDTPPEQLPSPPKAADAGCDFAG